MIRVGLTGNVASGKSAVAGFWAARGIPVVNADALARQVVEPGTAGLDDVRRVFGDAVVSGDGTLNRAALRDRVFADEEARKLLESILHPRIRALRDAWLEEQEGRGARVVVAEIPLLFETGTEADFDVTVLVDAPEEVRLTRMTGLRGLSEEESRRIMAAQMDPVRKRRKADHVLDNDGTLDDLERKANEVMDRILDGGGGDTMILDLHLHTVGSWDCLSDPIQVLERSLARGIHRIAITDHNKVDVALRMAEEYPDQVIPGEEVKTAEGIDVIGLYLTEEIPKGTPARETIQRVRDQGGIPYLPHPYAGGKGGGGKYAEELAPLVDVVEVFNARLHPGRLNAPAEELARRHGRLRGAGSDAHMLGELGGARLEVPRHANTPEALLKALARGSVTGRTSSNLVHLASTWAKVRKKLPLAPRAPW